MMKYFLIVAAITLALQPAIATAGRGGGGGGMRGGGGGMRGGGGGFNLSRDTARAPQTRPPQPQRPQSGSAAGGNRGNAPVSGGNRNNGNVNNGNVNNGNRNNGNVSNGNRNNGNVSNGNRNNVNVNNGNRTNVNVSGNTVIRNPVYVNNSAWGWNHGVAWVGAPYYWGGGFWGAMAIGVTSAAVYGSIVANNQTYSSYQIQPSSPGATFLSNYQLTQVQCGPPGLVVVYGPSDSVICANPNNLVAAGTYQLNTETLSLTSI
ncbi:MAG TPA: hypothetical protein VIX60_04630 [Candidatus Cybelea sp.]